MQLRYTLVTVALGALLSSCHTSKHSVSDKTMPSTWQATPIAIDGDSRDWPSPYPNYDSKAMIAYATSNDRHTLYITMQTGDQETEAKILKQGMTISIDTSGTKDPQFSIDYPLENDVDDIDLKHQPKTKNADLQSYENRKTSQSLNRLAQDANQFTLEGFGSCNGGYVVTNSPCGIKVKARIDEYNELVLEAAIPFKAIYGKDSLTGADAGRPISVCYIVKPFRRPKKEENNGNSAGDASMNNGMAGSGRNSTMRGTGRSGAGRSATDPLEHLYETTKTWKHFGLAYQ